MGAWSDRFYRVRFCWPHLDVSGFCRDRTKSFRSFEQHLYGGCPGLHLAAAKVVIAYRLSRIVDVSGIRLRLALSRLRHAWPLALAVS